MIITHKLGHTEAFGVKHISMTIHGKRQNIFQVLKVVHASRLLLGYMVDRVQKGWGNNGIIGSWVLLNVFNVCAPS